MNFNPLNRKTECEFQYTIWWTYRRRKSPRRKLLRSSRGRIFWRQPRVKTGHRGVHALLFRGRCRSSLVLRQVLRVLLVLQVIDSRLLVLIASFWYGRRKNESSLLKWENLFLAWNQEKFLERIQFNQTHFSLVSLELQNYVRQLHIVLESAVISSGRELCLLQP